MRDWNEVCVEEIGSRPSVTIFQDGWYRIERGGRVGVGPDAETAIRDLERQPPVWQAGPTTPLS
jgi:hypothetical protein